MKNKYVIRYTSFHSGKRERVYFTSKRMAEGFARRRDLPKSQIKRL